MTRDSVIAKWEALPARGRDVWVAEDVMGWTVDEITNANDAWQYGVECSKSLPRYSKDISAAFTVVDVMGDCLHLKEHGAAGEWEASFCGTGCDGVSGKTAPMAICLAALIANLVKEAAL